MQTDKQLYAVTKKGAALGLMMFLLWAFVPSFVVLLLNEPSTTTRIIVQHLAGIAILAPVFLWQSQRCAGLDFKGVFSIRGCVIGLAVVLVAYAATEAANFIQDVPLEPWLGFISEARPAELMLIALVVIIVVPISEELAFRHFFLSVVPFNRGGSYKVVAVILSATVFTLMHSYEYWATNALMFFLAIVFAVARIKSGGLLLPMILHGFASSIGLGIILLKL